MHWTQVTRGCRASSRAPCIPWGSLTRLGAMHGVGLAHASSLGSHGEVKHKSAVRLPLKYK